MAKIKKSFWIALIEHCQYHEKNLVRLWNGYVGWKLPDNLRAEESQSDRPGFVVKAPPEGWPELTEVEMSLLDRIAAKNGGHPSWNKQGYMDFSERSFEYEIIFSDLILVAVDFRNTNFQDYVEFDRTRFFMHSDFRGVSFSNDVSFLDAFFEAKVNFNRAQFISSAYFMRVQFKGSATFFESTFMGSVLFDDSKFSEKLVSNDIRPIHLAGFNGVEFRDRVWFRNVIFGEDSDQIDESRRLSRLADFSDTKFHAPVDFRHAVFNGAPTFFNCSLHEDTDFSRVRWPKALPTEPQQIDDAIRAWERLELMMSGLEKPLDRQIFYRLKMRARRLTENRFLQIINWLFEITCDYGWSISRAALGWFLHWFLAAILLFLNAGQSTSVNSGLELLVAALGTAFANAHSFLGLAGGGGYLEGCRLLIEQYDQFGLLAGLGVVQAVLGPILLFLLLLTLRNRFRLA